MPDEKESYSGESSYKYIDKLIRNNDNELMIISPYISDYYIKMLVREAANKKIRIITSESSVANKKSNISNFVRKGISGYLKTIGFLLLIGLISAYLDFNYTTLIITALVIITIYLAFRRYRATKSNITVKVARKRFIHEKIYIGKDSAIVGSANLTYNGMHKNIEHIELINDSGRVNELRSHFESMWSNN